MSDRCRNGCCEWDYENKWWLYRAHSVLGPEWVFAEAKSCPETGQALYPDDAHDEAMRDEAYAEATRRGDWESQRADYEFAGAEQEHTRADAAEKRVSLLEAGIKRTFRYARGQMKRARAANRQWWAYQEALAKWADRAVGAETKLAEAERMLLAMVKWETVFGEPEPYLPPQRIAMLCGITVDAADALVARALKEAGQ